MQTLDDAVALLNSRGLRAQRRHWNLGDTVVVTHAHGTLVTLVGEIEIFPLALYVVCSNGVWEVVDCMRSGEADVTSCRSLDHACDIVTARFGLSPQN